MTGRRRWYVVYTRPRAEYAVAKRLAGAGFEVVYLHYRGIVRHARKTIGVLKPLFPRYVVVGLGEGQGLATVSGTDGVLGVVYGGESPLELPPVDVEAMRSRGDASGLIAPPDPADARKPEHEPGTVLRICEGPLKGLSGKVVKDTGPTVKLAVEMFRGEVVAEMLPEHLEVENLDPTRIGFVKAKSSHGSGPFPVIAKSGRTSVHPNSAPCKNFHHSPAQAGGIFYAWRAS